jgi:hypothetical protein
MADPRTLFVGDVHGCARELELLLEKTRPTRVLLVGDLFTRGPDPLGVWRLVDQHGLESVRGNQDQRVLDDWTPGRELPHEAFRWLERTPWLVKSRGWLVVHAGVNPRDWRETRKKEAMRLVRWPEGSERYWWERYRGRRLVVHGHTGALGLLDRRPHTLGLDTACVRGGALTGYLLEEDRLVHVPALRDYTAVTPRAAPAARSTGRRMPDPPDRRAR